MYDFQAGGSKISSISGNKGALSLACGLISVIFSLSFWLGIGSLFLTSFAIPFALAGIILARSRLKQVQDTTAKAGLIVSVFGFLLNIAAFIMFIFLFS
ncbi:hypothetical protein EO98_13185 [Methanosarcina sp. 2.H.T.1A.6]|nr:hypothetical protein EO94_01940 [Methanosarcina sp. 2.H.T.1A.3]KKG14710.1 hypothetical protein EO97_11955 [Methanosarcina sp. 2.H.T.1A.15]KKG20172.1 hypothetical protein EO98_13185 [Methanosarcina sp. 2.H.T.1A.6]KKG26895.1 hypothetical protein EO96_15545 [Methanosarcina sp. 2.H.T.1A.8]KKH50606.1 hypothetical protein EO93_08070 [Methanosarcina sp. 1.H.A.2.2]KKH97027.1 hypothetical protein EO95_06635 [Methanosarcina sp. 1.H.T.1A.1]